MQLDLEAPIRGLPLWLLREYLEELGGVTQPDGAVAGAAWHARLTQLDDHRLGALRVGQVRLELTGDPQALAALRAQLTRKLITRGGG